MIEKISEKAYKQAYKILDKHADYSLSDTKPYIVYQYVFYFFSKNGISTDLDFLRFFKERILKKSYSLSSGGEVDMKYSDICNDVICLIRLFEHGRDSGIQQQLEAKLAEQRDYKRVAVTDLSHLATPPAKNKAFKKFYAKD